MTILTKDGKEYRFFSEPNPLVLEQDVIDAEQLDFHNFKWKSHTEKSKDAVLVKTAPNIEEFVKTLSMPDEVKITPEVKTHILPPPKMVDPFPNIGKAEKPVEVEKIAEPEKPKESGEYLEVPDSAVLMVWVLPTNYIEKIDPLYGEIRRVKRYGKKYEIESAILEISDLGIRLITDTKVEKESIIFASRYKSGEAARLSTWWEVKKVENRNDNFILEGMITDFHPDFSSL